jgi:hypothetical protein
MVLGYIARYSCWPQDSRRAHDASEMTHFVIKNVPSNFFFTAARTCYCHKQKLFTGPDDCAALLKIFGNTHNK